EASGGTPTASQVADAVAIAAGAGYKHAAWVKTPADFRSEFVQAWKRSQLTLIAAKVEPGQPGDLPPLRLDEIENKYRFMRYLEETENKRFLVRASIRSWELRKNRWLEEGLALPANLLVGSAFVNLVPYERWTGQW